MPFITAVWIVQDLQANGQPFFGGSSHDVT